MMLILGDVLKNANQQSLQTPQVSPFTLSEKHSPETPQEVRKRMPANNRLKLEITDTPKHQKSILQTLKYAKLHLNINIELKIRRLWHAHRD